MNSAGLPELKNLSMTDGRSRRRAAFLVAGVGMLGAFLCAAPSPAFPLWPKAKEKAAPVESGPAPKATKPTKSSDPGLPAGGETAANKSGQAVQNVPVEFVPSARDVLLNNAKVGGESGNLNLSVEAARAVTGNTDPMAVYRAAGVGPTEERKIRQLAQEFEGMQRVRLKLLSNLLEEMRQFELQTEPDAKTVLAKQDEINKLSDLMATERTKLILAIRDVMSHSEKENLVETLQKAR